MRYTEQLPPDGKRPISATFHAVLVPALVPFLKRVRGVLVIFGLTRKGIGIRPRGGDGRIRAQLGEFVLLSGGGGGRCAEGGKGWAGGEVVTEMWRVSADGGVSSLQGRRWSVSFGLQRHGRKKRESERMEWGDK